MISQGNLNRLVLLSAKSPNETLNSLDNLLIHSLNTDRRAIALLKNLQPSLLNIDAEPLQPSPLIPFIVLNHELSLVSPQRQNLHTNKLLNQVTHTNDAIKS